MFYTVKIQEFTGWFNDLVKNRGIENYKTLCNFETFKITELKRFLQLRTLKTALKVKYLVNELIN